MSIFPSASQVKKLKLAGASVDHKEARLVGWYDTLLDVAHELEYPVARKTFYGSKPDPVTVFIRPLANGHDYRPKPEDQFESWMQKHAYDRNRWYVNALTAAERAVLLSGKMTYADYQKYMNVWDEIIIPRELVKRGYDVEDANRAFRLLRFFTFVAPEYMLSDSVSPKPGHPYALFKPKDGNHIYQVHIRSVKDKAARKRFETEYAAR